MGLLDGKNALVCGVTNKSSIGWGIVKALHAQGARLTFTCVETNVRQLKRLVPGLDSDIVIPCDVLKDEDIESAAEHLRNAFQGRLDILVHSIAYSNISDLGSEFIQVSRSGWNLALEASAYSLASDLSSAVTGEILSVDSGMHTLAPPAIAHRRSPQKKSDS